METRIINVNGIPRTVLVEPDDLLSDVLRRQLMLLGTKVGCGKGECGACSVIMDGKVIRSCVYKMKRVPAEAKITTIEGIGTPINLHALQVAWIAYGGAQCGFCSPGFIVSAKGLLDANPNPTREEVRDWFQQHRNACRCTGYKPLVDAVMAAAKVLRGEMSIDELKFKMPEDGRIIGTDYPRPSAVDKVTGNCDYGDDLGLKLPPDTLHVALAQAKVSHARILSIDTSEAEKMPGVVKVLTHKDVKGKNRIFGYVLYPWSKNDGYDRPILCDEKIFQFGDAIAAVCADTEAHARAAADKVKVELEELPAYMNALDAAADDAIEIHPGTPNVFFEQPVIKGPDTAPIMESAPYVVEDSFYIQRQPHLTIEPDVAFANIDDEGRVTIYSKSLSLYSCHRMLYEGLGIEPDKLRMVQNPMGGTFGYKLSPTMEAILAVVTMATGRPAFMKYNYYQHITYTGKRSPFFINLKLAADKEGKLLAMEHDFIVDHGAYSEFGDLLTVKGCRNIAAGYHIPSIRAVGRCTFTNHAFGSAFRGYGSPQSQFASEVLMDELAEKIGMDRLEFRYKNVYRPGSTTPSGNELDCHPFPGLLDLLRPKYKAALERARQESTADKKRGVGITIGTYNSGRDSNDVSEAAAELNADGTVSIFNTWEDQGQGGDIGTLASAHESLRPLGIKPEQIKLVMNDTATCPNSGPSAASRSQLVTGNAIHNACEQLLNAMRKPDGSFRTYAEMVAEKIPTKYLGKYSTGDLCSVIDPKTGQFNPVATYMYGAFLSEVEVDVKTGKTRVLKMTMAADVGKVVNKLAVDGQLLGGLAQGIGLALSEDFEDIKKHTSMKACGLPFIKDVPDALELVYTETPRSCSAYGAAGCGELPLTSPHASIINAIYDACGVRITRLPALPEKVLEGLKALNK